MLKNARIQFTFYIIIVIMERTRAGIGLNCGAQCIWRIQTQKFSFWIFHDNKLPNNFSSSRNACFKKSPQSSGNDFEMKLIIKLGNLFSG